MRTMMSQTLPLASCLLVGLACLSCSSGSSAPANVYITSTLGINPAAGSMNTCNVDLPGASFVNIGSSNSPAPTGGTYDGQVVNVTCAVDPTSGSMYQVDIEVSEGEIGGITLGGTIDSTPGAMQGNIQATFNQTEGYSEDDCTLTLSTSAEFDPPIKAGRIAGSVVCPNITNDQTNPATSCYATATFFLDNCD